MGKGSAGEMTGAQVRMARAFLGWSAAELASKAGVGISTVQRIEASDGVPVIEGGLEWRAAARAESIEVIHGALIRAGITFLPDDGNGVGARGRAIKARK